MPLWKVVVAWEVEAATGTEAIDKCWWRGRVVDQSADKLKGDEELATDRAREAAASEAAVDAALKRVLARGGL